MKKTLLGLVLVLSFTQGFVHLAEALDDEIGPEMLGAQVSSPGPFQIGDRFTITLSMRDPGGSGVRNLQFVVKDKFGRQHTAENDDKLSFFSSPSFSCPGTEICEYPFVFKIDETWGNNGYVTFGNMRAYDMKTNGTYFYGDGTVENLQTKEKLTLAHPLKNLSLQIGTPPPPPPPTPTSSPTPTLQPSPTPTLKPSPTPTPTPTPKQIPVPTPKPTSTPKSVVTPDSSKGWLEAQEILQLKTQFSLLQSQLKALQKQMRKICSAKPKPKGC